MRPFTLLVKPTGPDCNLDCDYCFYLKKEKLYPGTNCHKMSDSVLHTLIESYFKTEQPTYTLSWQGGEPTLLGQEFFQRVISYEIQYAKKGYAIGNGLQTNGTLLDTYFAEFLYKNRFLVGVSLDGPEEMHDRYRRRKDGASTHKHVLSGISHLNDHNVEFNILTLVNKENVQQPERVYQYLKERGHKYLQFIPCVEFDEFGKLQPYAINAEEWGNFLCEIFDIWFRNDRFEISIREFDDILNLLVNNQVTACTRGKNCCQYMVVEHNGDVYPCDFFVEENLKLGNIMENSWEEMQGAETYKDFGKQKLVLNKKCKRCKYVQLCNGDCLKNRMYAGNSPDNMSMLCNGEDKGLKKFYTYTEKRFKKLVDFIRKDNSIHSNS